MYYTEVGKCNEDAYRKVTDIKQRQPVFSCSICKGKIKRYF